MNIQTAAAAVTYRLLVERDVDVPMRDGARLKADVIRPDDAGKFPAILNLGPYQKDKVWVPPDTLEEKPNALMNWETVNPEWWVPKGFACVRVDGRGSGKSPGQCEPWSLQEAIDFYDAIEWAAAQPWCNGKIGLSGISYYAINQWFVANLQPPSLHAIIPWEGFADIYRDALFHGGILSVFMTNWFTAHLMHHMVGRASRQQPDGWQVNTLHLWLRNNLDSGALAGAQAQWDRITVPMLPVGNWTGFALHLRGNTEAYMRAASKHKKRAGAISCASSITGSRASTTASWTSRRSSSRSARAATRSSGATSTNGRSHARAGRSSISTCRKRTAPAGSCLPIRARPDRAPTRRRASAPWARPRPPPRR